VNDLAEARDHAARLVQSFTSELSLEDCVTGSCMSTTTRVMNSSSCPSLSCSARRTDLAEADNDVFGGRRFVPSPQLACAGPFPRGPVAPFQGRAAVPPRVAR
jgi:hypothetical protein